MSFPADRPGRFVLGDAARRAWLGVALMMMALGLSGCGGYQLKGRVVEGPVASIEVVGANDPRLNRNPLPGAVLEFTIDPDSLNRKEIGQTTANAQGEFTKPISEFGAGLLMYNLKVIARRGGSQTAVQTVQLPSSYRRLLITLPPGSDTYEAPRDLVDDTMDMGRDYLEGRN